MTRAAWQALHTEAAIHHLRAPHGARVADGRWRSCVGAVRRASMRATGSTAWHAAAARRWRHAIVAASPDARDMALAAAGFTEGECP